MNISDNGSKENSSQKTTSSTSTNVGALKTSVKISESTTYNKNFSNSEYKHIKNDIFAENDDDLCEMDASPKRNQINNTNISNVNKLILLQMKENQTTKLISKNVNEDKITHSSVLIESEQHKQIYKQTVVSPPPGYAQKLMQKDDPKLDLQFNIEQATSRALKVTLNEDQVIDIDYDDLREKRIDEEEVEANLLYAHYLENQKKQSENGDDKPFDNKEFENEKEKNNNNSCYNLLEDDIIDKREILYNEYKKFFFDTGCQCDPSQNSYIMRDGKLSKPLQRKMLTLHQIMHAFQIPLSDRLIGYEVNANTSYERIMERFKNGEDDKGLLAYTTKNQDHKNKLFRLLRSICERVLIYDISLCDQYHYQVQQQQDQQHNQHSHMSSNMDEASAGNSNMPSAVAANPLKVLWNEMRNRSCQFLGPQVQEDVLNFVLRALEQFPRLSRRVLVYYVVFMLKKDYPKVSKTSIGHVVQLLYRAGCFKVEKRDKDASLMELKREYTKYEALRRQHDAQIIQIGMESGIRMTPEKWSQTLYGDSAHKSEMQSIIDKLQSLHTFERLIIDFYEKIKLYGLDDISNFEQTRPDFEFIASINFEKKQPRTVNDDEDNTDQLNDSKVKVPSSAHSEEDESNEYQEMLSEIELPVDLERRRSSLQQKSDTQQVHILWLLLFECQKRTFNILKAHAEFSAKIMYKIIANQNLITAKNSSQNLAINQANNLQGYNKVPTSNYSQQQQATWSHQGRSQNTRPPYKHQNHPNYVSNYDKRNQEMLNYGIKPMGTNQPMQYRQQQQFRNISNSTGASTGSSSSFSRGRNTPDFSTRSSTGYQSRGGATNSSGYNTWSEPFSTTEYDLDEMVNNVQQPYLFNNQDQQVFQQFTSKAQQQQKSSWDPQYSYNAGKQQLNSSNMAKQRTVNAPLIQQNTKK